MNRGPMPNSRPSGPCFLDKAIAAHGEEVPDWIVELAKLADREGLGGAEKRIGYSRSAISTVINGKYTGDVERVEEMVRGALMAATVNCPILGELARNRCLEWQKKPYAATSSHRVQMFVACQGCVNATVKKSEDAA